MGRSAALLATAVMLAACADFDMSKFDASKYTASAGDLLSNHLRLELESEPAGAEAKTSLGSSCRTPCSLSVAPADLTVTFALDGYEPQTVAVARTFGRHDRPDLGNIAAHAELDPNPARAVLVPLPPPPPPEPPKQVKKKKKPPAAAQAATTNSSGRDQASAGGFPPIPSASPR
jgi:hypothetical protein